MEFPSQSGVDYACERKKRNIYPGATLNRMKQNEIQNVILKLASNDYETTDTVRQNVRDELSRTVSEKGISTALQDLYSRGYVTSYIYDKQSEGYALIISPEEYNVDVLCWRVSG